MDIFWKNCNRVVIQKRFEKNRLEMGVIRNFTSWNLITRIKIKEKDLKFREIKINFELVIQIKFKNSADDCDLMDFWKDLLDKN